uniref:Fibronectin type-III domain-containing protein n=1 Tax=Timema cristinae TaxID=61476 RepID=A0A7R9D565_TIMCR|nr:unnamed protein product [Timema cristinae]
MLEGHVGRRCWKDMLAGHIGRTCWKEMLEGHVGRTRTCWKEMDHCRNVQQSSAVSERSTWIMTVGTRYKVSCDTTKSWKSLPTLETVNRRKDWHGLLGLSDPCATLSLHTLSTQVGLSAPGSTAERGELHLALLREVSYIIALLRDCNMRESGKTPSVNRVSTISTTGEPEVTVRVTTSTGGGLNRVENVRVENVSRDSATLSWDIPQEFDSTKGQISVCFKKLPAERHDRGNCSIVDVHPSETTIEDLDSCAWYEFTVVTLNKKQEKTYDKHVVKQFIWDPSNQQPDNLPDVEVARAWSNIMAVVWNITNITNDTCFSHFTICIKQSDDSYEKCEKKESFETWIILNQLELCTNYSITTWTSTMEGIDSDNQTLYQSTGPGSVVDMKTTVLSKDTVGIKWKPPVTGQKCLSYYHLSLEAENYTRVNITGDETKYLVTNLTACTNIGLSLSSVSEEHVRSNVTMLMVVTRASGPGDVSDIRTVDRTTESVIIKWTAPARGRECLAHYRLRFEKKLVPEEGYREVNVSADESQYLIANLTCCTAVNILLSSVSLFETQSNISYLQVTTRESGPDRIQLMKPMLTVLGPEAVTVRWKSPPCAKQFLVCWGAWQDRGNHTCTSVTNTSHTVTGLQPDTKYTFIVTALGSNEERSDPFVFTVLMPRELSVTTPKLNLKAVNATKDSLTVSWDVTSNPASRFQVCWGLKLSGEFPQDCSNATELPGEHVIKGLSPCQWYTVSVEALNENSDPLVIEEIIYFTDGGNSEPPGVSENLIFGSQSDEIGALLRERGEPNGTCVYSFTVCWKKIDGLEEDCRVKLAYQHIIIKDLEHCTNYTVTTYTSSIEGLKSTNKTWYQSTGPGKIENLTLTPRGPDSIAVKWEPPTQGWSCGKLVNILVQMNRENKQNVTALLNQTEHVVYNLESCTILFVFIRVISEEGVSSKPIWREAYTAANAPGQVEDLKVFETKSHGLHVKWSPPSENKQCLFKYSVCWREAGKTQQRCEKQGLGLYPEHSIYRLHSCTEYIVTVASMGSSKVIGNTTGVTVFTGKSV